MTNKRFLKKLLATSAVVGTLAAGAMEAQALADNEIARRTTGNVNLTTGAGLAVTAGGGSINNSPFLNGQTIRGDAGGARTVAANKAGAKAAFDTTVGALGLVTVTESIEISAVAGANGLGGITFGADGKTVTLNGKAFTVAQNTDATGAGPAIAMNTFTKFGDIDFNNKADVKFIINTTGTTLAAPVVIVDKFLNTTGGAATNKGRVVVADGNHVVLKPAGGNGVLFGAGGNNIIDGVDVGSGSLTIDSHDAAGNVDARSANGFRFTANNAGSLIFNANNGNDINAGAISSATAIGGDVLVYGGDDVVFGAIGAAGNVVKSIKDVNGVPQGGAAAAAQGARNYAAAVFSAGSVEIGQQTVNGGLITIGNNITTTNNDADIIIMNKGAGITFGGANTLTSARNVKISSVDAAITGAGQKIIAGGNVEINTGTAALANAFGDITAIKGNTSLAAGNAAGVSVGVVKTKQLTYMSNAAGTTLTFGGAGTALSNADYGLVLNSSDANFVTTVNVVDGKAYIGNIKINNDNKNIINFASTSVANAAYIGNVGDATHRAAQINLTAAAGTVAVINGSNVYTTVAKFANAADNTIILGDGATIFGDVDSANVDKGTIKLASVPKAAQATAGNAVVAPDINFNAKVNATIQTVTGKIGNTNLLAIDFGTTAAESSLTVKGIDNTALVVKSKNIIFSTNAGVAGNTLALSGGTDHNLIISGGADFSKNAGNVHTAKFGSITSDTKGEFKITNAFGLAGEAPDYTQNALGEITALNANTVVLTGGDAYVAKINMGKDKTLVLGDGAARNYMIHSLTDGVNIKTDAAAAALTLVSGTNLGKFNTFTLANGAGVVLNVSNDVTLDGNLIIGTATNAGEIHSTGNATINSVLGSSTYNLAKVTAVTFAERTAIYNNDIYSRTGLELNSATTNVNVNGSISGSTAEDAGIDVNVAAHTGLVQFTNGADKAITISGDLGKTNVINKINVGAGQVTVQNAAQMKVANLNFNDKGTLVVRGAAVGLNTAKITAAGQKGGTLAINSNMTRVAANGDIGAQGSALDAIRLDADVTFDATDINVFANLTTATSQTGTAKITLTANDATILDIRDYKAVTASVSGGKTLTAGTVNAQAFKFGNTDDQVATLNLKGTSGLLLTSAQVDDIVNVRDGGSVGGINSATAGKNVVNFLGNGTIADDLGASGALAVVNFKGGSKSTIKIEGATINAPVTQDATTLMLTDNSTINGTYTLNNSTVNLGDYKLRVEDTTAFVGDITMKANLNQNQGDTSQNIGGQMSLDSLNIDKAKAVNAGITIKFDTKIALPTTGTKWAVATFDEALSDADAAKLFDILNIQVVSGNPFLVLTKSADKHGIYVLTKRDFSTLKTKGAFSDWLRLNADKISSDSLRAFTDTGLMNDADRQDQINRLEAVTDTVPSVSLGAQSVLGAISARTGVLGSSPIVAADAGDALGTSAGDAPTKMGAWISGFTGTSNQGMRKGVSGYKSTTNGGVVGFDTILNESLILGAAAGYADTKVKYKDDLSGGKSNAKTFVFSVYGTYDFGNSWVGQATAMIGNGKVKNTALRRNSLGLQTATAKFDSVTGGGEVLGGYKFVVADNASITPLAGLGYTRTTENGYTETGTTSQNFKVSDRITDKFEGILGARASTQLEANGMIITPEAHAFMNYDFRAKAPKVTATLNGASYNFARSVKPARTTYNLGAGVMLTSDMIQYGATYDAGMSDKRIDHQGTLKVRVNF